METSLHRALKDHYGSAAGGRSEVSLKGFRVDAIGQSGLIIEIQSGPLGPLRSKLRGLLPEHRVRVVKPVPIQRRVIRRARVDGPDLSARRSPKRGEYLDVFEDMVGLARLLQEPNLSLEILGVVIAEIRIPRRRWPGFKVADRLLIEILDRRPIQHPEEMWGLLPEGFDWTEPFTTADLSRRIGRPLWLAQRIAYCLRHSGAARPVGKAGNSVLYMRSSEELAAPHRAATERDFHSGVGRGRDQGSATVPG